MLGSSYGERMYDSNFNNFFSEKTYIKWIKRFIFFHGKRHPMDMGEPEISEFLTHLVFKDHVTESTSPGRFRFLTRNVTMFNKKFS